VTPPFINWMSRHGGKVIFVALLLTALLEGVAIWASRR
jgi:hypothetical protein